MKEIKETHTRGHLSVAADFKSLLDCDFGIQIAEDGRVWICIDGIAFIRFKPSRKSKAKGRRMKVYGFEPTDEQIGAAIEYMEMSPTFMASDIERVLINYDVPEYIKVEGNHFLNPLAHRVADRLMQKLKKQNKIELVAHNTWQWVA